MVLAAVASESNRTFAEDITVFVGANVQQLDPHRAETYAEHAAVNALHRGLTAYNEGGALIPGLAESWAVSPDGRTYTFTLKENLTWSNGRPLVADDVVAGLQRALTPGSASPFAAKLFVIADAETFYNGLLKEGETIGVDAPDPQTVVIKLARRDVDFLHTLSHPVSKPVPAADPTAVTDGRVTSGSFVVASQGSGAVTLTPRDNGPALILQPTASVRQAWTESSRTEHFLTAALPIVSVPAVGDRGEVVRREGGDALYAYAVNTARAPLNTLEVRHAMAMAINRSALLERVGIAGVSAATQFVPPSAMTYAQPYRTPFAALTREEREAVAAALLSERGYGLENRLAITLRIPEGDIHAEAALMIAEMWVLAGIDTEVLAAPFPAHWRALAEGDFDVAFVAWPGRRDTPRDSLEPLSRAGGPWNWPRYDFRGFDERIARAAESEKDDVRAAHFREAEKALIEDQSLLALFFYRPLALISSKVTGWQPNDTGIHPLDRLSIPALSPKLEMIRPSRFQLTPSSGPAP